MSSVGTRRQVFIKPNTVKALKPLLPKITPLAIPINVPTPQEQHGGTFFGDAYCYVCDCRFSNGYYLVNPYVNSEKVGLPSKIMELMGDGFVVVVTHEDVICVKCHNLLVYIEGMERELVKIKNILREYLAKKYECFKQEKCESTPAPAAKINEPLFVNLLPTIRSVAPISSTWAAKFNKESQQTKPTGKTAPVTREAYRCTMCNEQFSLLKALKNHKLETHLSMWTCHFCDVKFKLESDFTTHMKQHLSDKKYVCTLCNEEFGNQNLLDDHIVTHNSEAQELKVFDTLVTFPCNVCNLAFFKESDHAAHMQSHDEADDLMSMDIFAKPEMPELPSDQFIDVNMLDDATCLEDYNSFVCQDCDIKFKTSAELSEHLNSMHVTNETKNEMNADIEEITSADSNSMCNVVCEQKEVFVCQQCGGIAEDRMAYDMHKQQCDGSTPAMDTLTCGMCGTVADSAEELSIHMDACGQETIIENDNVQTYSQEEGIQEEGEINDAEPGSLETEPEISDHLAPSVVVAKKTRSISCMACGTVFADKAELFAHEQTNPDHLIIQCPDCDESFPRERLLNDHRENEHCLMHCRHCNKEFTNLKQLKAHEARHARSFRTVFQCPTAECGRVFQTATGFRHHLAEHNGEYKYECEFCYKGFVSKARYEEHRACHTKEERYTCEVCDKKFSVQATYWIHRKWHDNPTPYKCQDCGMLFKHSSLLAVHKRKHTGDKPYTCPYCDQAFFVSSSLKRHVILHTGDFPYTCSECKTGFLAKHKLATHMSKVHNDYQMVAEQAKNKSRKMVMAIKDPGEVARRKQERWTAVAPTTSAQTSQFLTLGTNNGEPILLTDDILPERTDEHLVEIVLNTQQPMQL